eukprot:TRINITY_DN52290_c0_g1_i1.p2 TRINITY_DN52290_c0_g1~~TRINITY_DN52290_c0_g1_i1.p2  ORF type:complete len:215 (+),score=61.53 TRINITY_DN52290_c0_g1_i1:86-730(+)
MAAAPCELPHRGAEAECWACGGRLDLTERYLRCGCGGVFCDRHRPSWQHGCSVDYHRKEQQRLRALSQSGAAPSGDTAVRAVYRKTHSRGCRAAHLAGTLLAALWAVPALWALELASAARGLLLGALLARAAPAAYVYWSTGQWAVCDGCLYSLGGLQGGWRQSLRCELDSWAELAAWAATNGQTNCMTRDMYARGRWPEWGHVVATVRGKLGV